MTTPVPVAGALTRIAAVVDSFVRPGGRSSARLIAIGAATCAAVYILTDAALRVAVTIVVVLCYQQAYPLGIGMTDSALSYAFGTLVVLGGGTYWLNKSETTKRAKNAEPGGDDAAS